MNLQAQRETLWTSTSIQKLHHRHKRLGTCPYSPCYWRVYYVNFNGRHHFYSNGTWEKAEATLLQPERDLPTSFRYNDDNAHDYEAQANDGITTSHMNIIADLAAAMAEQSMKTGINSSTAIRNIIVAAEEKNRNNQLYELVGNIQDHHVLHWSSNHLHHRLQNPPMAWRIQDDMELLLHT
ncbi:Uncharacterized protein APZ42_005794 [Daphnia magna]|uniref:Uncharacterized protein n=1 Tax=Daphnia magna TaxID=35525 RepID=A0A164G938_9CRUS|nr:Uncharacterized protein APZ42_005794 [Daphnia magna]